MSSAIAFIVLYQPLPTYLQIRTEINVTFLATTDSNCDLIATNQFTVKSQFLKPPRETKIGSRNRVIDKLWVK